MAKKKFLIINELTGTMSVENLKVKENDTFEFKTARDKITFSGHEIDGKSMYEAKAVVNNGNEVLEGYKIIDYDAKMENLKSFEDGIKNSKSALSIANTIVEAGMVGANTTFGDDKISVEKIKNMDELRDYLLSKTYYARLGKNDSSEIDKETYNQIKSDFKAFKQNITNLEKESFELKNKDGKVNRVLSDVFFNKENGHSLADYVGIANNIADSFDKFFEDGRNDYDDRKTCIAESGEYFEKVFEKNTVDRAVKQEIKDKGLPRTSTVFAKGLVGAGVDVAIGGIALIAISAPITFLPVFLIGVVGRLGAFAKTFAKNKKEIEKARADIEKRIAVERMERTESFYSHFEKDAKIESMLSKLDHKINITTNFLDKEPKLESKEIVKIKKELNTDFEKTYREGFARELKLDHLSLDKEGILTKFLRPDLKGDDRKTANVVAEKFKRIDDRLQGLFDKEDKIDKEKIEEKEPKDEKENEKEEPKQEKNTEKENEKSSEKEKSPFGEKYDELSKDEKLEKLDKLLESHNNKIEDLTKKLEDKNISEKDKSNMEKIINERKETIEKINEEKANLGTLNKDTKDEKTLSVNDFKDKVDKYKDEVSKIKFQSSENVRDIFTKRNDLINDYKNAYEKETGIKLEKNESPTVSASRVVNNPDKYSKDLVDFANVFKDGVSYLEKKNVEINQLNGYTHEKQKEILEANENKTEESKKDDEFKNDSNEKNDDKNNNSEMKSDKSIEDFIKSKDDEISKLKAEISKINEKLQDLEKANEKLEKENSNLEQKLEKNIEDKLKSVEKVENSDKDSETKTRISKDKVNAFRRLHTVAKKFDVGANVCEIHTKGKDVELTVSANENSEIYKQAYDVEKNTTKYEFNGKEFEVEGSFNGNDSVFKSPKQMDMLFDKAGLDTSEAEHVMAFLAIGNALENKNDLLFDKEGNVSLSKKNDEKVKDVLDSLEAVGFSKIDDLKEALEISSQDEVIEKDHDDFEVISSEEDINYEDYDIELDPETLALIEEASENPEAFTIENDDYNDESDLDF